MNAKAKTSKAIGACLLLFSITFGMKVSAQCGYADVFSTNNGWTSTGNGYLIGPNTFSFSATPCGAYNYVSHPLNTNCILNNNWCADIDFNYQARSFDGVAHSLLSVTSNTLNSWNVNQNPWQTSNNNVIEAYISCPYQSQGTERIYANSKSGTAWGVATAGIAVAPGNTYFLRLQRLSATQGMLSAFSDAARTQLISAQCFTIAATVGNLGFVQMGAIPQGAPTRRLTGTLDNLNLSDFSMNFSGPQALCSGTSGAYCVGQVCGASGYTWAVPSGWTINNGQGTICVNVTAGSSSGTLTCTAVYPGNACSGVAQTYSVTVYPLPIVNAGPDICRCPGAIFHCLNASISGGTSPYTYTWTPTTSLSCTNCLNPCVDNQVTTTYTLTVTDANGCQGSDVVVAYVGACSPCKMMSISEGVNATHFKMYPNPNAGAFDIVFESTVRSERSVMITDLLGNLVYTDNKAEGEKISINMEALAKGVYIVKVMNGGVSEIKKVIIE